MAPSKDYADIVEEWPPEEVVAQPVQKQDGDGGDDQASPDKKDDGEPEEEKKFNPKEFQWTNSNANPKACSQIYNKLKPAVWVLIFSNKSY